LCVRFGHPMPVTYEIIDEPAAVLARYSGRVGLSDISNMFQRYRLDPSFSLTRPHIADIREFDSSDIGFSEIYALFSMYGSSYAQAGEIMRVAIIAPDEVSFGMSRIFENLTEQSDWARAAIFDNLEDAKSWIKTELSG